MTHPTTISYTTKLTQVKRLDEFRTERGARRLNMPYYRRLSDGALWFDFIRKDTDVQKLMTWIGEGCIYRIINE
ncbi:MAG: hypothetical protein AAGF85_00535 [Bacteroidota bacterium]